MAYRIEGLDPALFADTARLRAGGAIRMIAEEGGAPCRVSLEEAQAGEPLLLVNFVSADVGTPFRACHAIFVREGARAAAFRDAVPAMVARRTVSLRAFDGAGMMRDALLAGEGGADGGIRALLDREETDHVDIHSPAWGCFLARAERA